VVVVEILGVVHVAPEDVVAKALPPDEAAYHFTSPPLVVADRSTVPVPVREPSVVELMVRFVTVAVTAVREAEVHEPSTASA
jgi:hypothetical protein